MCACKKQTISASDLSEEYRTVNSGEETLSLLVSDSF